MSKGKKFQKRERIDKPHEKTAKPSKQTTPALFSEDMTLDQISAVIKSVDPAIVINNDRAMVWIDTNWKREEMENWVNNLPEGIKSESILCVRILFRYLSRERLEKVLGNENKPEKSELFPIIGDILPDHSLTLFMDTNPEDLFLLYYDRLSEEDRVKCFGAIKEKMKDPDYERGISHSLQSARQIFTCMKNNGCTFF